MTIKEYPPAEHAPGGSLHLFDEVEQFDVTLIMKDRVSFARIRGEAYRLQRRKATADHWTRLVEEVNHVVVGPPKSLVLV